MQMLKQSKLSSSFELNDHKNKKAQLSPLSMNLTELNHSKLIRTVASEHYKYVE